MSEFGERVHADSIENYNMFREHVPITNFEALTPYFNSLYSGEYSIFLADMPRAWVLSRSEKKGVKRNIPLTSLDLHIRMQAWPRSLFGFIKKTNRYELLEGVLINLTYPSQVKYINVGAHSLPAGYPSGITARFVKKHYGFKILPNQDELDKIPSVLTRKYLRQRYQVIMKATVGAPVVAVRGDVEQILGLGKYIRSKIGKEPKRFWDIALLICTGTTGIHAKYKLPLRALYGDCTIVEYYETAEGSFMQQADESPTLVPNYDLYFYEALTRDGPKPLYSMMREEVGELIISSSVLPRYNVGDVIKCMGHNRFQILGRKNSMGRIKYDVVTSKSSMAMDKDIW